MFEWIGNLFARQPRAATPTASRDREYVSLRSWMAGKIDRLNQGRWPIGGETTFDSDLGQDGANLRLRNKQEIQNNGILEGVIFTHVNDIVGADGPKLNVDSDDKEFNAAFEALWEKVWAMPDLAGQDSGAEILQQAIRGLWHSGFYLGEITNEDQDIMAARAKRDPDDPLGKISVRLAEIHPRRLSNPQHAIANDKFQNGIERDQRGRILNYWIEDEFANDPTVFLARSWTPLPPESVVHIYAKKEPGNTNGAPLDAPALETVSGLHDLDDAVLEAARGQTYASIVLTWPDPDKAPARMPQGTMSLKKNSILAAPPGANATGFTPTQPTIQYIPYRHERLREIGRPVGMPLMMVLLDSSGHNYSSARFDNQVYLRGIDVFRACLWRKLLDRFVVEVLRECRAGGDGVFGAAGRVPKTVKLQWHWPATPHVDPAKEFKGDEGELKTGLATLHQKTAERGRAFDDTVAILGKEIAALKALGIVHPALLESAKLAVKVAADASAEEDGAAKPADEDEDERAEQIRQIVSEELETRNGRSYSGDLFAPSGRN